MSLNETIITSLIFILLITAIVPVHATIMTQAFIDQSVYITFDFEVESTLYSEIVEQNLFNVSAIPDMINANFEQQDLKDARCNYDPTQEIFIDATNSMHVECYLIGSDIRYFTINPANMTKTIYVRTDWRNFLVNLTNAASLNFTEHFAKPVSQWEQIDFILSDKTHLAYYHNSTSPSQIDPSFYFILPEEATKVHAVDDTIIFEAPLSFGEVLGEAFLNSPLMILAVMIVVVITGRLYREVRR